MSKIIGLPIIKIKNKDTGDLIREISVKNTTTAHLEYINSPNNPKYILGDGYPNRGANNPIGEGNVNAIYTLPFVKTKSRRFSGGSLSSISFNNLYEVNGEKYASFAQRVGSETGLSLKIDASKKAIFTFHGALPAPSASRNIGTVGVVLPSSDFRETLGLSLSSNPAAFTPLEEVIVQDSTMIVDIVYNLIIDCSSDNAKDYGAIMDSMIKSIGKNPSGYYNSHNVSEQHISTNIDSNNAINTTCVSYDDNTSDKYHGYLAHRDISTLSPILHLNDSFNLLSPALKYDISLESMSRCGDMIGSISSRLPTFRSIAYGGDNRKNIQNVKSGRKNFTVYEKTIDSGDTPKPFLDIQRFKKGTGKITASGTKQKWLPERWEVEVVSDGTAGVAKFKVRKNYTSSYAGNTNNQIAKAVPHLSPNISGHLYDTQFNHKHGKDLTFKSSMFKLWDFNIALVSRKAAAVTLATDNKYIVFDETNLIPNSGKIMLNGLAWDVNTKELILSCQINGLYRISNLDINTDQVPVVTKVDGVGRIYAITTDGFGGIGIVTADEIKFSKDLAKTWAASISKQECTTNTGFTEDGFEKISIMLTDFKSEDFKTLFIPSVLVNGTGNEVWISTSEKAGTRVKLANGKEYGYLPAASTVSYNITNEHIAKVLEIGQNRDSDAISKLFYLNSMPQSMGYVYNGLFNLFGLNGGGNYNGLGARYIPCSYKDSTSRGSHRIWSKYAYHAITVFEDSPIESGNVCFGTYQSSNDVVTANNSDSSYNSNSSYAQDIYYHKNSETAIVSGIFIPSTKNNSIAYGVGGVDYSIIRLFSHYDMSISPLESFDVDNIPELRIPYSTYIAGSLLSDKIGDSFYIKYAKKPDGSFSSFVRSTTDSEEFILSGEVDIDGVKISASADGEFKAGDVYTFIRYDGIVNDNLTTGVIKYEASTFDMSEEVTQTGTVSYEAPKPLVKFNIIDHFDGRVTRDGYIKSESDGAGFASSLSQSIIYGDFKLPISLDNLNGVFGIDFLMAPIDNIYAHNFGSSGYYAKLIIGKVNGDIFYTFTGTTSPNRNPVTITASTIKTNTLSGKSDLHILYDGKTRVFRFMAGTQELARTSAHNQSLAPVTSVYMYALNTSVNPNGSINTSFMPRVELTNSGGVMLTGQSVMKIPEFQEANGNVLCTILGNRERNIGYYDSKFIGIGGVPGDSIKVEIAGKPATVLMNKDVSSIKQDRDFKTYLLPRSVSVSAGYDSSLSEGQVYVDHTAGLVVFSNDDRGKQYSIKYKYYKDNKFGIDEVANE